MAIDRPGWKEKPRCTFRIGAPEGWTVATGLAGVSGNVQEGKFPEGYENGVISMGRPVAVALQEDSKLPIEVVQWGGSPGPALPVRDFARAYVAQCIAATGTPPRQPIRLLITEPHSGGTRSDGSIAIACPDPASGPLKAGTLHFVAHELFHDWLGGQLRPVDGGERLAWFWEGFTDYLSLWLLVRAGLVEPETFAARMQDYDDTIAGNEHRKTVSYTDPQVNWRDPAIEPLAYKGSALLAFSLDVALRRAGHPGLMELVRALLARSDGRYDLDVLKAWIVGHGLETFWNERLAAPGVPDLAADFESAGFERAGTSWKPVEGRDPGFFRQDRARR
jgi:predicted metalloprotease with PDZ domain